MRKSLWGKDLGEIWVFWEKSLIFPVFCLTWGVDCGRIHLHCGIETTLYGTQKYNPKNNKLKHEVRN